VVHAVVGMDEVSPSGLTSVWEVRDGTVTEWAINPADFGLECKELDGLAGGDPAQNARRLEAVLAGTGNDAETAAIVLNAAAAVYVAGPPVAFAAAVERAREALESGAARAALAQLRAAAPAAGRTR